MYGDLVNCNNCSTENMVIEIGSDICPICGAIGTLSWADEENQEVNEIEDKILKL